MKTRKMVRLIHAEDFFPPEDVVNLQAVITGLNFAPTPYGLEVPNFNMIAPECETMFYKVLGERVCVDPQRSGVFRKPNHNSIHFEHFESIEEWCFIIALENTTVNFWYHIDQQNWVGDFSKINAKSVLDGYNFDYKNLFEWKIHTNILLEPNQCLFFRPWCFHSLEEGLVQYYRLLADNSYRILVMGMPQSVKSSVAKKLTARFQNTTYLNSYQERVKHKDIDFSVDGQLRHSYRMLDLARRCLTKMSVIDMACPLPKMREILNPDILIWVNDHTQSQYQELNEMFIPPNVYDIECSDDSDKTIDTIIKKIISKR